MNLKKIISDYNEFRDWLKYRRPFKQFKNKKISKGTKSDFERICKEFDLSEPEFRRYLEVRDYRIEPNPPPKSDISIENDFHLPLEKIKEIFEDIKRVKVIEGKIKILSDNDHRLRNIIFHIESGDEENAFIKILQYLKENISNQKMRYFFLEYLSSASNLSNNAFKEYIAENSKDFDRMWDKKMDLSDQEIKDLYLIRLKLNSSNFAFLLGIINELLDSIKINDNIFKLLAKNCFFEIRRNLEKYSNKLSEIRTDLINLSFEKNTPEEKKKRIEIVLKEILKY